jgi:hypothetical protein
MMNHTTTRTTKTLAIAAVVVLMLASIAAAAAALIGAAAAITSKDPSILDFENSATNYSSEQKEKNNCSSVSNTQCTNDATQSTRSREEPETTGTLLVKKVVVCNVPVPICTPSFFSITVTDNNPQPSEFQGSENGTLVTLGPGDFTVEEGRRNGFTTSFSGDCKQTAPGSTAATGTISAGQQLTCTITNRLFND